MLLRQEPYRTSFHPESLQKAVHTVTLSLSKRVPVTLRQAHGDIAAYRWRRKYGFPGGHELWGKFQHLALQGGCLRQLNQMNVVRKEDDLSPL